MVDCLKKSAGYAHALGHYQQNSNWLKFRDMFEEIIPKVQMLATAKSMPRQQLLLNMEQRKKTIDD